MSQYIFRMATEADAERLLAVYAAYMDTNITFEAEVPTVEEFAERIRKTLQRYPYLVAEEDGEVIGYAYAGPLNTRQAYDWSVECSIYVKHGLHKKGMGRVLYTALENALALQNIINVISRNIGTPAK